MEDLCGSEDVPNCTAISLLLAFITESKLHHDLTSFKHDKAKSNWTENPLSPVLRCDLVLETSPFLSLLLSSSLSSQQSKGFIGTSKSNVWKTEPISSKFVSSKSAGMPRTLSHFVVKQSGKALREQGLKPKRPVFLIPGNLTPLPIYIIFFHSQDFYLPSFASWNHQIQVGLGNVSGAI